MQRRHFLHGLGCLAGTLGLAPLTTSALATGALLRPIPASGERIPAVGMGTWITFDVGEDPAARAVRVTVLREFFQRGGGMIDSSPMYGTSEAVVGHCLAALGYPEENFSATKVWIYGEQPGIQQMQHSRGLWGLARFDLMQVHNLLDWETQLRTLKNWKAEGKIRYLGVTTSHGRRHEDLERLMKREPLDFVQLTYNIADREAERRLLPLAAERGIAVICNRPFRRGSLFRPTRGQALPGWAAEFGAQNWAQFLLKYIVSHPAVTCAIPATSKVAHMQENMGGLYGALPDESTRRRMVEVYRGLS